MSKPDKPGELRGVTVNAISLVSKAANGERFKIFKSAEPEAPEIVKKDERGLFRILKEFFTGEDVEKGAVADLVNTRDKGWKLGQATDALFQVLGLNRWGEGDQKIETDVVKIRSALNDFMIVAENILIGSGENIEKAGRKISGSRLSKLKDVQAMLTEVLSGLEENTDIKQEAEDLTKEEVMKAVDEAIKPVNERVEKINVEEAVKEAIEPLIERIEKIENARGVSNRVPEDGTIEKDSNNLWGDIF